MAGVAGCSQGTVSGHIAPDAVPAPALATPLATSVQTSEGTWATIPMGRLDEPLNTFWQLFYRPRGGGSWTNQVEATATATNGGLVLAPAGGSLLVGVRPSVDLTFTPLISTPDGGRSWSDGLITEELASRPDALASAGADALALVGRRTGAKVVEASGDLSTWRALATEVQLAAGAAGKACGLGALTAVGFLGPRPLVGGTCSAAGVAGLFAEQAGHWQLAGPALPGPLDRGRVEVLAVRASGQGALALLAVVSSRGTCLVAARTAGTGNQRWSTSAPLATGDGTQVTSYGPGPSGQGGFFALLQDPSGVDELALWGTGGAGWQQLPSPPAGTATVAFGPGRAAEALAARGSRMTVWSLAPGSRKWSEREVMDVPVQYGSSS